MQTALWIALTLAAFVTGALMARALFRSHFRRLVRLKGDNVVDEAKYIQLGGIRQWVTVRGRNRDNPLLIFIHGGPGAVMSGITYSFQTSWEEFFTVVNWDQRGAGRSTIDTKNNTGTITFNDILGDAVELIEKMKEEYGQEKVYIVGHSWGSFIGVHLAKLHPNLVHAYIGVGQLTGLARNTAAIWQEVHKEAEKRQDTATLEKLEKLPPTIPDPEDEGYLKWIATVVGLLPRYGMSWHNQESSFQLMARIICFSLLSPRLTIGEAFGLRARDLAYGRSIFASIHDISVPDDLGAKFDMPVIIVSGKYDNQAPIKLAREYYEMIEAPKKEMYVLEQSAHVVFWEEQGMVLQILLQAKNLTKPD